MNATEPIRPLPVSVLERHTAVVGMTGSGKTSTSKLLVEQVVDAGYRVCILDSIKSDWWGITSSADGKKAGLPFRILGGPHGHVPLHASAGAVIGELVGSGKLPLSIVDMADFGPGGLQQFFVGFAPALMRHATGVVYLVLEEAHEFAPKERSGIGAENMAIHWAKKLATAGRSKGIRLVVATQRIQSLHNAVLGSCETIIAHRLRAPADQAPVVKWLTSNADKATEKAVVDSLSSLQTGTAWVCSGEAGLFEKMRLPKFRTFDNNATPTRDGGEIRVKTAAVDQDELRALIGDAVAEAEANDPKRLKARIAELERQAGKGCAPAPAPAPAKPDPAAIAAAEARAREQGRQEGLREGEAKGRESAASAVMGAIQRVFEKPGAVMPSAPAAAPAPSLRPRATAVVTYNSQGRSEPPVRADGGSLPEGERKCLIAIAQHVNGVRREQLTVLTGYKRSTRDAYIQRLKGRGLVDQAGERVVATEAGVSALGSDYDPLPTGAALRDRVLRELPYGEARILDLLIGAYPGGLDRERLSELSTFKRSTRDAYIQRLVRRELVEQVDRGEVRASGDLF